MLPTGAPSTALEASVIAAARCCHHAGGWQNATAAAMS